MLTHLNSVTGVPVCRYFCFHGNRSAVSSAKRFLCLAPSGISLKVKIFAYYSASLRLFFMIIPHDFSFVKCF